MRVRRAIGVALAVTAVGLATFGAARATALKACGTASCPIGVDDTYAVKVGVTLHVPAPGILANDAGIAGTKVDLSSSDSFSANFAKIDLHADGSFTYTPDPKDPIAGDDSFGYAIEDPEGDTDTATVEVNVSALVRDDTYSTRPDTTLSIRAPGIFANDAGIDTSSLTADNVSQHGGSVTVDSDGSALYSPPSGFSGADTFNYTVSDSNNDHDYTATVHVKVSSSAPPNTSGGPPETSPATTASGPGNTAPRSTTSAAAGASPGATSTSTTAPAGSDTTVSVAPPHHGDSATPVVAVVAVIAILMSGGGALWWRRRRRTTAR